MNEKFNTVMPETTDRALCIMVDKPVSGEGYKDNFLPRAKKMIDTYGALSLLVYFKDYKGWEEDAAMMDFAATQSLGGKVKRFAMVNPPPKMMALQALRKPVMTGETKVFSEDELQKALVWIKEV